MVQFKPLACGFHSHSDQSMDGGSTVEAKIMRADALGRIADCVTDHGTMSALSPHWLASKKLKTSKPIKSIHGIELYVIDDQRAPKQFKNGNTETHYYHLTVHFKDEVAYKYFCQLTPIMESRALVKFGERKPLIKKEELLPISGHITVGTGCLMGMVQKNLLPDDTADEVTRMQWAADNYAWLRQLAGKGNFFVEVFPHVIDHNWSKPVIKKKVLQEAGSFKPILEKNHVCGPKCCDVPHFIDECGHRTVKVDIQLAANKFVVEMAKIYGDPIVISEDSHVAAPDDKIIQDVRLGNGAELWKFYNNYCMEDSNVWGANLKAQLGVPDRDIEEWIDNSYKFVDCFTSYRMETAKDRMLLPTTEMVYGEDISSKIKLRQLIEKHGKMPSVSDPNYQVYLDRMNKEIAVYADNGIADFLPYLFVIEDAAEFARKNDILMNTRGSAGGSLLVYLLAISVTDPIKYGLQFERMLTIGRIKSGSLPDIDTDWQDRGLIIDYILKKYGAKAALISTNMLLRVKSSIKDVERYRFGSVSESTANMLRQIKPSASLSDLDWLYGYTDKTTGAHVQGYLDEKEPLAEQLKKYADETVYIDEQGKPQKLWAEIIKCLSTTRTKGVHAGGVVITPQNVSDFIPLLTPKQEGILATAYTMKDVEEVGGVKYDFLGVKTLASLGISMRALRDIKGVNLEWGEFPHDDLVYANVIHAGKLSGLFQISTDTMRPYTLKIKPRNIQGVSNIISLVRPGCLEAPSPDPRDPASITAAEYYILCAQGVKQPYYIHQDLIPILSNSYGVILTQEQTLQIFRDIGGYTFEEAEEVRRGIGKKIKALLEKHGAILKAKCLERKWTQQQADLLFDSILASARYSFNNAHSTSYAIVSYNGAWLKHNHPAFFWLGELSVREGDRDKLREYLKECGHLILPISVLKSHPTEWTVEPVNGVDMLRPPMCTVKSAGHKGTENLKRFIDAESAKGYSAEEVNEDDDAAETVALGLKYNQLTQDKYDEVG